MTTFVLLLILGLLIESRRAIHKLTRKVNKIMATQADAAAQLSAISDELDKVAAETTQLLADIQALKDAAANAPITPELQAAIDKVSSQAKKVDDLVPDAPPAP